jgi:hypothetical protein
VGVFMGRLLSLIFFVLITLAFMASLLEMTGLISTGMYNSNAQSAEKILITVGFGSIMFFMILWHIIMWMWFYSVGKKILLFIFMSIFVFCSFGIAMLITDPFGYNLAADISSIDLIILISALVLSIFVLFMMCAWFYRCSSCKKWFAMKSQGRKFNRDTQETNINKYGNAVKCTRKHWRTTFKCKYCENDTYYETSKAYRNVN